MLKNVPENATECLHSPFFYSQVLFRTVRSPQYLVETIPKNKNTLQQFAFYERDGILIR